MHASGRQSAHAQHAQQLRTAQNAGVTGSAQHAWRDQTRSQRTEHARVCSLLVTHSMHAGWVCGVQQHRASMQRVRPSTLPGERGVSGVRCRVRGVCWESMHTVQRGLLRRERAMQQVQRDCVLHSMQADRASLHTVREQLNHPAGRDVHAVQPRELRHLQGGQRLRCMQWRVLQGGGEMHKVRRELFNMQRGDRDVSGVLARDVP